MNHLFIGQDPYLKEKGIEGLKAKYLPGPSSAFDLNVFYGDTDTVDQIAAALNTLPMVSQYRIIILKKTEKLPDAGIKVLSSYLDKPNKRAVFIMDAERMGTTKAWAALAAKAKVKNFSEGNAGDFDRVARREASALKKTLTPDALARLKALTGGADLQALSGEISKLAMYAGERQEITAADVNAMVAAKPEDEVFRLTDAIKAGKVDWALEIVSGLLLENWKPYEILGAVAWHIRKNYFSGQGAAGPENRLRAKVDILIEADYAIKRSVMDSRTALELALVKLCRN